MFYTKEEAFNIYCDKVLERSYDDELNSSRRDIYDYYRMWYTSDDNINAEEYAEWKMAIGTDKDKKEMKKLQKRAERSRFIGKTEFYKMLANKHNNLSYSIKYGLLEYKK
jgi:hypothetical protein